MKKLLLSLALALTVLGCTSTTEQPVETKSATVSPEEFVAWVGSGSMYIKVFNNLSEADVLGLNPINAPATTPPGILFVTAWRDGVWQLEAKARTDWSVRFNLAVENGKVVGTVGESKTE